MSADTEGDSRRQPFLHVLQHGLLFLYLTVLVLLLIINAIVWHHALTQRKGVLMDWCKNATAGFNTITLSAAQTLEGIISLPVTERLLEEHQAHMDSVSAQARERLVQKTAERWDSFNARELLVREVLDNPPARFFRQLCVTDARFRRILLTDGEGRLLAASAKPEYYDFREQDWWQTTSTTAVGRVLSLGFSQTGQLNLSLAATSPQDTNTVKAVIMAEIEGTDLFSRMPILAPDSEETIFLLGPQAVWLAGSQENLRLLLAQHQQLVQVVRNGQGRIGKFAMAVLPVRGGLVWTVPHWIVVAGPGGQTASAGLITAAAVTLASMIFFVLSIWLLRRRMQQRVLKPLAQRVHAGDWVMRNALVRSPQSRLADIAEQHRAVDSERLIEQLDEWLAGYEKEFHDEVNLRTAKMRHDLDLARDFQRAILERPYPRVPDVYVKGRLRLEFCHSYHPASALGGDFFNIIKLGRSTAGIFVADVMGHGTRSALITSMLRTLIGDLMGLGRNAPHFLSEMNKQFHGILLSVPNPLFASAFYFVADTTARVATYSSAGHPPPYHIRRHVGHVSRLTVPPPRGAALGAIADEEYSGGHCRLVKDDVFIFYTDGVYEAFNSAREEFGVHRMEKALKKHMYGSLQDIVDGLLRAVLEFAGDEPMADDVCIVGMEVTTRAPGEEAPVTGGE
jgi:serine phosphatase RsbU (regulator of sigma subunit)